VAALFSCSSHEVKVSVAPGLPDVVVDEQKVHQVLSNLVSNAIKFSPGAANVFLSATVDGAVAEIRVLDEGIGIPKEKIGNLFQMFYRVDNDEARSIGGTGLGLTIVKRIVEGHGGEVRVESAPGRGSTFSILLPVHGRRPDAQPDPDTRHAARPG
jgi:signal transduction histidine kinase